MRPSICVVVVKPTARAGVPSRPVREHHLPRLWLRWLHGEHRQRCRLTGNSESVGDKIRMMNDTNGLSGSPMPAFLEATKIDLDQVLGQSTRNIKQLKGIMPQIEGTGTVRVQVGISDAPQDGIRWQVDKTFNVESDHKIDFRTSGRYFALRIESNSASDYWRLTGLDIDVQEVAGR